MDNVQMSHNFTKYYEHLQYTLLEKVLFAIRWLITYMEVCKELKFYIRTVALVRVTSGQLTVPSHSTTQTV